MAAPNEVRVSVRHNVLILKTFTVPQLQAITGLNRQSIHTEVRRMEREGLVSRVGTKKRKKGPAGGRPPIVYQLTSAPEKRFEVLQQLRAFYVVAEERSSESPRPESKHYYIAKEMVDEVVGGKAVLTQDQKTDRLALINKRLEYARREEGVGKEGTELIDASLKVLEAKAIEALTGDWEQAVRMLDEARQVCRRFGGADDLVAEIQACVRVIATRMVKACPELGDSREVEEVANNLRVIKHRFGDLPEVSAYFELASKLAVREEQIQERMAVLRDQVAMAQARAQNTLIINALMTEPISRFLSSRERTDVCVYFVGEILRKSPIAPQLEPELDQAVHRFLARLLSDVLHEPHIEPQLQIELSQDAYRMRPARNPEVHRYTRALSRGRSRE